jgi:hypothetical protein
MRELKPCCHRCGSVVTDGGLRVLGSMAGWLRPKLPASVNLCHPCGEALERWWREQELDQEKGAVEANPVYQVR